MNQYDINHTKKSIRTMVRAFGQSAASFPSVKQQIKWLRSAGYSTEITERETVNFSMIKPEQAQQSKEAK